MTAPTDQTSATARTLISVDAMGGDEGPAAVVAGCLISAKANRDISFILHGREASCGRLCQSTPSLRFALKFAMWRVW